MSLGSEKNSAAGRAGARLKNCKIAFPGQRTDEGMLGIGTKSDLSLCWIVLDHFIRKIAPEVVNLRSLRVRCLLGSKAVKEGTVRLDFRRKEKNARVKRLQRAASVGLLVSSLDFKSSRI